MKFLALAVLALFTTSFDALAGGSVGVANIQHTLKTQPALAKYLNSTLKFDSGGSAVRLGRNWPHLGGARIGPYTITVTTKDDAQTPLELTVYCEQTFYDENGKILPLENGNVTDKIIKHSTRVEEKVSSISLTPAPSANKN